MCCEVATMDCDWMFDKANDQDMCCIVLYKFVSNLLEQNGTEYSTQWILGRVFSQVVFRYRLPPHSFVVSFEIYDMCITLCTVQYFIATTVTAVGVSSIHKPCWSAVDTLTNLRISKSCHGHTYPHPLTSITEYPRPSKYTGSCVPIYVSSQYSHLCLIALSRSRLKAVPSIHNHPNKIKRNHNLQRMHGENIRKKRPPPGFKS